MWENSEGCWMTGGGDESRGNFVRTTNDEHTFPSSDLFVCQSRRLCGENDDDDFQHPTYSTLWLSGLKCCEMKPRETRLTQLHVVALSRENLFSATNETGAVLCEKLWWGRTAEQQPDEEIELFDQLFAITFPPAPHTFSTCCSLPPSNPEHARTNVDVPKITERAWIKFPVRPISTLQLDSRHLETVACDTGFVHAMRELNRYWIEMFISH